MLRLGLESALSTRGTTPLPPSDALHCGREKSNVVHLLENILLFVACSEKRDHLQKW